MPELSRISRIMAKAIYASEPLVDLPVHPTLPEDLKDFYRTFGGGEFFPGSAWSFAICAADELQRSDMYVVGEDIGEEVSANWYVIATCDDQTISICLAEGPEFGRCYDSYWDIYPTADPSTLIAASFTDLLEMIVSNRGHSLFWIPGHH